MSLHVNGYYQSRFLHKQLFSSGCERYLFRKQKFDVKELKMNKFIKPICQLIISTSNATFEVPSLIPCSLLLKSMLSISVAVLLVTLVRSVICDIKLCESITSRN